MSDSSNLGALLRQWRADRNFSQREAARSVRVEQSTWCRWERGTLPSGEELAKLAVATRGSVSARRLLDALVLTADLAA